MQTIFLKNDLSKTVTETIKVLKEGGLVIAPSDTVYGLLVDATNEKAVKKLIEFKNRPAGKAISVFVNFSMLDKYVTVGTIHELSLRQILPGPFTVILKSKHLVSRQLESEKGTLGIRIPDYELINRLIDKFQKPVTATSANISGKSPHYSIESFLKDLPQKKKDLIDLIIDTGKLPRNKPSTIIDLTSSTLKILRKGDIVFKNEQDFVSQNPNQTKKIAQYIVKKILNTKIDKPIIFIIEGELGVGKTIFVKGVGEYFGIKNIISPTYVVSYEYKIEKSKIQNPKFKIEKLVHYDLYNIAGKEEFKYLGIENYLNTGNILCFEWGEKAGEIMELLKSKGRMIYVKMKYENEDRRSIQINF